MKGHNFIYFLKEGIKGIFVHGFMSFAAVSVIVACLLITGSFALVALNVNVLIDEAKASNEILAFVDDSLSDTEALALTSKIYQVPNVLTAEFITRDEALEDYYAELGEDADEILVGITGEDLRHRYRVQVVDLELADETATALERLDGIGAVRYSQDLSDATLSMQKALNVICYILAAILVLVSVFIIANTVKLATMDRREEIAIMKMVGATNAFIRWPFIVQGSLLGVTGGIIAYFAQWGVYSYLTRALADYIGGGGFIEFLGFGEFAFPLLIVFLAAGLLVGVLGGILTIRKFMKV